MPSACLGLWLATSRHQAERLAVEVVEVLEAAAGQEIVLDIGEGPLDPAFAVRVSHPVRAEPEAQGAGEGRHLRRDDGVGTGAGGEQDAGVVDDADRTDARHEADRLQQERFGLEAGEPRVVLDEQPARVGQHQAGALHGDGLAGWRKRHPMRRGVVLHLLAGREVVFAGAPRRAAQVGLPDPTGQGAVAAPSRPSSASNSRTRTTLPRARAKAAFSLPSVASSHGGAVGGLADRLDAECAARYCATAPAGG